MLNENNSKRNNYLNNLNNSKESVFNFCLFNKKKTINKRPISENNKNSI